MVLINSLPGLMVLPELLSSAYPLRVHDLSDDEEGTGLLPGSYGLVTSTPSSSSCPMARFNGPVYARMTKRAFQSLSV